MSYPYWPGDIPSSSYQTLAIDASGVLTLSPFGNSVQIPENPYTISNMTWTGSYPGGFGTIAGSGTINTLATATVVGGKLYRVTFSAGFSCATAPAAGDWLYIYVNSGGMTSPALISLNQSDFAVLPPVGTPGINGSSMTMSCIFLAESGTVNLYASTNNSATQSISIDSLPDTGPYLELLN